MAARSADADGPLATATAFSGHGLTLLEGVAALPRARGRGAGAAAARAATTAFPDQPAVLLASDDGQPVYERMGYLRRDNAIAKPLPARTLFLRGWTGKIARLDADFGGADITNGRFQL